MRINKYIEKSYLIFFLLLTFGKSIGWDSSDFQYVILTDIAMIFLVLKFIFTSYSWRDLRWIGIVISLAFIVTKVADEKTLLLSVLSLIGLKGVKVEKLIKWTFIVKVVCLLSMIYLSSIGIINNEIIRRSYDTELVARESFGYGHPNIFYMNFSLIIYMYIYIYYEKLNLKHYLVLFLINFIFYRFTYSRTGFLLVSLAIIITILLKILKNKRLLENILVYITPIIAIISFSLSYIYKNNIAFINYLNKLLTGRIEVGGRFLQKYAINMFGNKLIMGMSVDSEYMILDNSYIKILLQYGSIVFILYIMGSIWISKRLVNNKMYKQLLFIGLFAIYGFTEGFIINAVMNPALLFLGTYIFKKNRVYMYDEKMRSSLSNEYVET